MKKKSENKSPLLCNIDLLRGIAAISILFWHYQHFYYPLAGVNPIARGEISRAAQPLFDWFSWFYLHGALAVHFFLDSFGLHLLSCLRGAARYRIASFSCQSTVQAVSAAFSDALPCCVAAMGELEQLQAFPNIPHERCVAFRAQRVYGFALGASIWIFFQCTHLVYFSGGADVWYVLCVLESSRGATSN